MVNKPKSFLKGLMYVLLGGAIVFVAVIVGIQIGYAIRGNDATLASEPPPNNTTLQLGTVIPSLPIFTADGDETDLRLITRGNKTVVAVVLPGCEPCKQLLDQWLEAGITDGAGGIRIVLLSAMTKGDRDLGPLADYRNNFSVYFCNSEDLKRLYGLTITPSLIGIGPDNRLKFADDQHLRQYDAEFFDKHL